MRTSIISSAVLALVLIAAAPAGAVEVSGTITYEHALDATFLVTPEGARLELDAEAGRTLRRFRKPDLGLGSGVDLMVRVRGELTGTRLRVEDVVSPVRGVVTGKVLGEGEDTRLAVQDRELRAHGPGAFVIRAAKDQVVTVRSWIFTDADVVFIDAVQANVIRRTRLQREVRLLTTTHSVAAGRADEGEVVWLAALTGDALCGYYLSEVPDRRRFIPRDSVGFGTTPTAGITGALSAADTLPIR